MPHASKLTPVPNHHIRLCGTCPAVVELSGVGGRVPSIINNHGVHMQIVSALDQRIAIETCSCGKSDQQLGTGA